MILDFRYDSSVASAPVEFTAALERVATFFETNFHDPVTVTIGVGYGEINGQAFAPGGGPGSSFTNFQTVSYSQLRNALIADASSAADMAAVASLPAVDPIGTSYRISRAEAKALGLSSSTTVDGYVGFTSDTSTFDYDNSDGVTTGTTDFFAVAAHEISEVMGRQMKVGQPNGWYTALDLFHFSAPNQRIFVGDQAGYFSIDNGATNLSNFNTRANGDYGDWAINHSADAFNAFAKYGVVSPVSDADIKSMDAIGWDVSGVPSLPDLTVSNVAVSLTSVSFTVDNTKPGSTAASTTGVYVSVDQTITSGDTLIGTHVLAAGSSNQSATDILPTSLAAGTYYVGAYADSFGVITETDEANNSLGVRIILGNDNANSLAGTSGADTMIAAGGNDTLDGAGDADVMAGGMGSDSLIGGAGTDILDGAAGNDSLDGGDDADALGAGDGADSLAGGTGADTLDGGAGIDTASFITDTAGVNANLAAGTATGLLSGNDVLVAIEYLAGGTGNDTLIGDANANGLVANAGDDRLSGGAGNDTLDGGAGIDTVVFSGLRSAYSITLNPNNSTTISGPDGTDILTSIEKVVFNDLTSNVRPPVTDLNGDGNSDFLWHQDNFQPAAWLMNGPTVASGGAIHYVNLAPANPGAGWHIKGSGDFNSDGNADIIWQQDDGKPAIWLVNGLQLSSGGYVHYVDLSPTNPGSNWHIMGSGDFNSDGNADLLWQDDTGMPAIWLINGFQLSSGGYIHYPDLSPASPGASWHVKGAADFNGDGNADVLWQDDLGNPAIWLVNGFALSSGGYIHNPNLSPANLGAGWHIKGAGDFDGDGKADVVWQHDDGRAAIWLIDGFALHSSTIMASNPGTAWDLIGAGDYNGDGKADIQWQNDNGQPMVWLMDGVNVLESDLVGANPGPTWHLDWV